MKWVSSLIHSCHWSIAARSDRGKDGIVPEGSWPVSAAGPTTSQIRFTTVASLSIFLFKFLRSCLGKPWAGAFLVAKKDSYNWYQMKATIPESFVKKKANTWCPSCCNLLLRATFVWAKNWPPCSMIRCRWGHESWLQRLKSLHQCRGWAPDKCWGVTYCWAIVTCKKHNIFH